MMELPALSSLKHFYGGGRSSCTPTFSPVRKPLSPYAWSIPPARLYAAERSPSRWTGRPVSRNGQTGLTGTMRAAPATGSTLPASQAVKSARRQNTTESRGERIEERNGAFSSDAASDPLLQDPARPSLPATTSSQSRCSPRRGPISHASSMRPSTVSSDSSSRNPVSYSTHKS